MEIIFMKNGNTIISITGAAILFFGFAQISAMQTTDERDLETLQNQIKTYRNNSKIQNELRALQQNPPTSLELQQQSQLQLNLLQQSQLQQEIAQEQTPQQTRRSSQAEDEILHQKWLNEKQEKRLQEYLSKNQKYQKILQQEKQKKQNETKRRYLLEKLLQKYMSKIYINSHKKWQQISTNPLNTYLPSCTAL